jgi:hypothetical protein
VHFQRKSSLPAAAASSRVTSSARSSRHASSACRELPCSVSEHRGVRVVELKKADKRYQRGHCVGHEGGRAHFVAIDSETGEPVCVDEWEVVRDEKDVSVAKHVRFSLYTHFMTILEP